MNEKASQSKKKDIIKKQIQKIQSVFNMSPEAIKKHPQLGKLLEFAESADGKEKYVVGNGDTYVVYNPQYATEIAQIPKSK
ncbi:MAG: hypothetical protein ABSE63_02375 [Thermoguttaceae bacterium]|jgi:hypothetical protein